MAEGEAWKQPMAYRAEQSRFGERALKEEEAEVDPLSHLGVPE